MSLQIVSRPAWWLDPAFLQLLFILPMFVFIVAVGSDSLGTFGNFVDNIDGYTISLGIGSLISMIIGAFAGKIDVLPRDAQAVIRIDRVNATLRCLGILALAAYSIYLGPWALKPEVVIAQLQGGVAAAAEARDQLERIPGITSFMQLSIVFFALYAAAKLDPEFRPTADLRVIFVALIMCAFVRAMLASERLALIEVLIALYLPRVAFQWRSSLVRSGLPLLALVGLFMIFFVSEYFRSWQYYKDIGNESFFNFVVKRFAGYFIKAIKKGIGGVTYFDPLYFPDFTAAWFYRFPLWQFLGFQQGDVPDIYTDYLAKYGNLEFNNFSGIYAAFIDYGIAGGMVFMFCFGYLSEVIFMSFLRRSPLGLILYPTWYVGLVEIIRIYYLGDSRVFPIYVSLPFVAWYITDKRKRDGQMKLRDGALRSHIIKRAS